MTQPHSPELERRAGRRHRREVTMRIYHSGQEVPVITQDIGSSGLLCQFPMALELYTKYRFQLMLSDCQSKDCEVDGEGIVVRVEPVQEEPGKFWTALYFQHFDDGSRDILEKFLAAGETE